MVDENLPIGVVSSLHGDRQGSRLRVVWFEFYKYLLTAFQLLNRSCPPSLITLQDLVGHCWVDDIQQLRWIKICEGWQIINNRVYSYNMNITSSVSHNGPAAIEDLHRVYMQGKDLPNENVREIKFKSKIRIKSKSQGKFGVDLTRNNDAVKISKTINLMSVIKEVRPPQSITNIGDERINNILPQEPKVVNTQREILFLKQLVNRRKEIPVLERRLINRSNSQSQLNQSHSLKSKYENSTLVSRSQQKLQNISQTGGNASDWDRKIDEYQYYDNVVKDLLSQMSTRKYSSKPRPLISPSKYCQAKQKLILKMQEPGIDTGLCNFKSVIKIQPKKDSMVFRMSDYIADTVYQKKITSYIKFLYKVNFSNCIYTDLTLNRPGKVYKVKVGPGNNSELIKVLIKRRFWLEIDNNLQVGETKDDSKIAFIWTQSTIDKVFQLQKANRSETSRKIEENERFARRLKKFKKIERKKQSFILNQKILSISDAEEAESHYQASNNGSISVYSKVEPEIVSNHIPSNYIIGSKKVLFLVLHWYYQNILKIDPFTYLPKTYHIKSGQINNPAFQKFLKSQGDHVDKVWIVKPGENTNRGNGINVASFNQVAKLIRRREVHKNGDEKTYIIQKYLKPFLYNGRKFDIRHYLLITSVKGNLKAYWYKEGYIRTSSEKYDIEDLGNEFIHLTNDAIQKKSDLYGKYEPGNKLSYTNFQRYLDQNYPQKKYSFQNQILRKMKQITTDLIHASFSFLDPERKDFNFELYGMDFMINSKFEPFLIQVNANPCLQVSCPVLERIIPTLVEHTFRLALDPLFPPPEHFPVNCRYQLSDRILEKLKFQLIFQEKTEGSNIRSKIDACEVKFSLGNKSMMEPDEQIFQDEGENEQNFQID